MDAIAEITDHTQSEYPDIRYHFQTGAIPDILTQLETGMLDFGLLAMRGGRAPPPRRGAHGGWGQEILTEGGMVCV